MLWDRVNSYLPKTTFLSRRTGDDKTDNTDTKYCNSIGCSDGYTPIDNAHDVNCDDGKCEEKQCCEAFCSYYACPNNYTPVYDADTIKCDDSGCTTNLCCEKVSNRATIAILFTGKEKHTLLFSRG